ncbi:MAG: VOC family protein [Acidimicrobiaceae bacterium]|jgi:catechol 2,3-dioxygenase-like lactoylglutathione lyase family enzyme
MPVSEIHHVAMIVSDLERSVQFYEVGLGYKRTLTAEVGGIGLETAIGLPSGVEGNIQYLQGPSRLGQLELIQWKTSPGPQQRRDHTELGPLLLSFEAPKDELSEIHDRFVQMGANMVSGLTTTELQNFGFITAFSVRDPDGNLIEIVALPTREEILAFRSSNS